MGIMDFIENMRYGGWKDAIKDICELTTEAKKGICEAKDEFTEIMTDGFRELVIKGKSEYRTSNQIKTDADILLDEIEGKYGESLKAFEEELSIADQIVRQYELYCEQTINDNLSKWLKIIEKFDSPEIWETIVKIKADYAHLSFEFICGDIKNSNAGESLNTVLKHPSYKAPAPSWYRSTLEDVIVYCVPNPIPFKYEISQKDRVNAAKNYEEAVKNHEISVDAEIIRHKKGIARLDNFKKQLHERMKIMAGYSCKMNDILNNIALGSSSETFTMATLIMSVIVTVNAMPALEENTGAHILNELMNDIKKVEKYLMGNGGH